VSSCDRLATVDAWLANDIASGTFDAPRFGPTIPWPQHEVLRWVGLADLTPRA
jgi:hypothetical protein